jgi:DNA invertase Pin-like site-specific DNA recombinase
MGQDLIEYATYARKSNGRKAVPRQKALIAVMIQKQGGTVIPGAEFSDRDSTAFAKPGAARPKRDDFDRMLAFLEARSGVRIAAYHADRLLRNSEDTAALIRVCAVNGHLIETHSGGVYDLSTANGRRRLRDDASAAEFEVDRNTERVLVAKDEAAAAGLWLGGRRPLGWEADPAPLDEDGEPLLDEDGDPLKGVLRLVPAEADAIRAAFTDLLEGGTVSGIARKWNAAGITGTSGARWTGKEVGRVLRRPRNAGLMEHRGQVTGKASWAEIVDEPTWRTVCAILADPRRKTTTGPERKHLLSGIARCGVCGGPMVCSRSGPSRGRRAVYRCRRGVEGDSGHVARDAGTLDTYITAQILEGFREPGAEKMLLKHRASELPALYRRKADLDAAMKASNDLRKQGLLTSAEFAEERKEHQEQTAALDAAITHADQGDVLASMVRDPDGTWDAATLDKKRSIISASMELAVHPQPKGRPKGWKPGEPYFDGEIINKGITWKRG